MTRLEGIVTDIAFQNEENGFTVIHLNTATFSSATCVGVMPTVTKGESIAVQGDWENHKKFGPQFIVKSYEIIRPTTIEGIEQLLSSGLIRNIGSVRARQIIDTFGIDTLAVLDSKPERLLEVEGIGRKTMEKIRDAWQRQRHIRDLMLFLQEFDVSINLASKIYKAYGVNAKEKVSSDPYALIDDLWGVGFVKADRIAQKMGYDHNSYKRIRAGVIHCMQEAVSDGHTFLPLPELTDKAASLLGVSGDQVTFTIDNVVSLRTLIREETAIYLPMYYYAERSIAEQLGQRLTLPPATHLQNEKEFDSWIASYQIRENWTLDKTQIKAIKEAVRQKVFLLTGGPGTGKTTVIQVLVAYFQEKKRMVSLAAPTGRAAQRMSEVSGLEAKTLHRLLEFRPGNLGFGRCEENPLEAQVIIVDEVSMIDLLLMKSFLSAVRSSTTLIFVGDDNQLPSVGAGNVLANLIASKVIPHVHLVTVFRQAAASRIVTAAHEMITGQIPAFANSKDDNCFFMYEEEPQNCVDTIVDLVCRRLPSRYQFDPVNDIQVLSPMHKGPLGTQHLNMVLQKQLIKTDKKIIRGETVYCLGDKVMQIRNDYEKGVFNGDIGKISAIEDDSLTVNFDGMHVEYEYKDLDEIVAAYCISIHKSQGSEFKAVIIPLHTQHFIMLQRNLLYTALTRARKMCILIGTSKALAIAVKKNQAIKRYSRLDVLLSIKASKGCPLV